MKPVKSFLFLLCACLCLAQAQAQAPAGPAPADFHSGPLYVSLSTGIAIPVAGFGGKNAGTLGNSVAKVGSDQNIQVDYRVWQMVSLTLLGGYQANDYNDAAFNASSQAKESGVSVEGGAYYGRRLLGGFTMAYSIGNGDRWYFTNRLLAGIERMESLIRLVNENGSGSSITQSVLDENFHTGFASELGLGLKYRLSRFWYVEGGADFLTSTCRLSGASGPLSTGNAIYGGSASVTTLNLHLGIGARI